MKKVFSFLVAALVSVSLFAAPVSFTFVTSGSTSDGTNSKTEVADIFATNGDLVTITTATKIMQGQDGWGMKMGNSSTDGVLEFALVTPLVLDSIVADASAYSATENTLKINNTEFALGGAKGTFVNVKLACDGTTAVSSIKLEAAHRAYVKGLHLYAHEASEGGEEGGSEEGGEETGNTTEVINGVTFVYNGGVTNANGWTGKAAMWNDWGTYVETALGRDLSNVIPLENLTPAYVAGTIAPSATPTALYQEDNRFYSLAVYVAAVQHAQHEAGEIAYGTTLVPDLTLTSTDSYWRWAWDAFFISGQRTAWPGSADFSAAGTEDEICKGMNIGWCGNDSVLPRPFFAGESFLGWYTTADFQEGTKVTEMSAVAEGATLYAKHGEYIPTIAEIAAMPDSTMTKALALVNYRSGKNVFMQDATGALCAVFPANPSCSALDVDTVYGMKIMENGRLYLKDAELKGKEKTATAYYDAAATTIGQVNADPAKYFAKRIALTGVKITSYVTSGNYNDPYLADGLDTLYCYINLDPTAFPVGRKINVTATLGEYHGDLQLVGFASEVELALSAGHDAAVYEEKTSENGSKYAIANDWLFSNYLGNFAANKPNPLAEQCRSMVVKDGIMYFPWRYGNSTTMNARLIRVDAMTGEMLDPIVLADSVMRQYTPMVADTVITDNDTVITKTATKEWATDGEIIFASCSDLKLDEAGHAYLMNLQTGNIFTVWEIDLATGAAHNVIYIGGESGVDGLAKMFPDAAGSDSNIRIDRMGIVGDLHADGSIYGAQNANGNVFRFDFSNGVWDGQPVIISCAKPGDESSAASFGDAPQIYPVEGGMFYVDGAATFPTLYDEDGNVLASFNGDDEKAILLAADPNVNASPNGVREFELNGEYFMVMAGSNYDAGDGVANSTTLVFKCLDANRNFNEMTPYWVLPQDGMSQINRQGVDPQRVCVSHVDVDEANHTATLYIFAAEQGYGKYTITATPAENPKDALENIEAEGVTKMIENGQVYIIKNGVKYNVLGAVVR